MLILTFLREGWGVGGGGGGSRDMGCMTTVICLCLGKLIKIKPIDANWKLMTNIQIVVLTQLYIGESISSSVQL